MPGLGEVLDFIGGSLEKPGRAVRGALAGKPREALAALPFSDTLGITDPKDRTSGRQLLNQYNLVDPADKGWGTWGAGLAADVATDPLSYLPAHAMAKPFLAARKAGAPAAGLAEGAASLRTVHPSDYLAMAGDEGSPLGRLFKLSEAAHVPVFPSPAHMKLINEAAGSGDAASAMFRSRIRHSVGLPTGNAVAVWDPTKGHGRGAIVPNVLDYPGQWSDLGRMRELTEHEYSVGQFSTPMPEHVASHEIGHGLHLGRAEGVKSGAMPGLRQWIDHPPEVDIEKYLSRYALTNPREFVAEAFAKRMNVAARMGERYAGFPDFGATGLHPTDNPPWLPLDLHTMYQLQNGPAIPPTMLSKLREYTGGPFEMPRGTASMSGGPSPLPINRESMTQNSAANNASRARRFSTDQAKHDYYSHSRQERFGRRFGNSGSTNAEGTHQLSPRGGDPFSVPGDVLATGPRPGMGGLSARLRPARAPIPVAKLLSSGDRLIGGDQVGQLNAARLGASLERGREAGITQAAGMSVPSWSDQPQFAGAAATLDPRATREEILHAMTQRAAAQGNVGSLPPIARPAAALYRASNATGSQSLAGLAQVLDELSAKTMAGRSPMGKAGAFLDFLFNPEAHRNYHDQFAKFGAIPNITYHGVPASVLGAPSAGALAYGLEHNQEQ